MSPVSILNLSLSFTGKTLFKDIGFQIEPGDRVGLIGPNGAGKTTLLNIIMGEITPESGETRKWDQGLICDRIITEQALTPFFQCLV